VVGDRAVVAAGAVVGALELDRGGLAVQRLGGRGGELELDDLVQADGAEAGAGEARAGLDLEEAELDQALDRALDRGGGAQAQGRELGCPKGQAEDRRGVDEARSSGSRASMRACSAASMVGWSSIVASR
jgi:hypothetical protein